MFYCTLVFPPCLSRLVGQHSELNAAFWVGPVPSGSAGGLSGQDGHPLCVWNRMRALAHNRLTLWLC